MRVPVLKKWTRREVWREKRELVVLPYHNVAVMVHPGDDTERILYAERKRNLVVASGREVIAYLIGNRGYAPSSIGVGTDGTPTTDSMDDLGAEVFRAMLTTRKVSGALVTLEMFLATTEANGNTLQEAGLFADQSWYQGSVTIGAGTLFARVVHTPVEKTAAVSMTYRWEIPISAG